MRHAVVPRGSMLASALARRCVWPQIAAIEDDDRAGVECGCSLPRGVGGVICAADYSI